MNMNLYHICCSVILGILLVCNAQQPFDERNDDPRDNWSSWRPPWGDTYHATAEVRTVYGDVVGFTIPWHIDDQTWYPGWSEYPPWATRRINCFLGIPYAKPPVGNLRFRRPKRPTWGGFWDATYYRPTCPQKLDDLKRDIPEFPRANMSEDCLYMNIFAPNYTKYNGLYNQHRHELYPVLIWLHSGDFTSGSAQTHPGHVLATRDVVVVTLNYRLGALGFLSLQDTEASGNWGLFDQHMALEFVKENIKAFRGDPDRITLAGDGSGAVSVGMHLLSEMTRDKPRKFFHQCIMMSGTDLSRDGFLDPYWKPRKYALDLADLLGCFNEDTYQLMKCMRDNNTLSWQRILSMQELIVPRDGSVGVVWAPTQDGGWFSDPNVNLNNPTLPYLKYTPADYRSKGLFEKMPCIIGLNTQDGAKKANESRHNLAGGLHQAVFEDYILQLLNSWGIMDIYKMRAMEAIEFQYTYWPDPSNNTARVIQFIDFLTDLNLGTGMNQVLKYQAPEEPQWFYRFNYNSWNNWLPSWMGCSVSKKKPEVSLNVLSVISAGLGYSAAVPYFFGIPFMNETVLNDTGIVPRQYYDYDDRNMSDWMIYMWTNFIKEGHPTPNMTRNITWEPYSFNNLSYLIIDYHPHLWFRYRQEKYSFWEEYFPEIAKQLPYFVTPTPAGYQYVVATGLMSCLVLVLICAAGCIVFLIWMQSEKQLENEKYHPETLPLGFLSTTRTSSQATLQSGYSRGQANPALDKTPPEEHSLMGSSAAGSVGYSERSRIDLKSSYPYLQRTLELQNPWGPRPSTSSRHPPQHSVV